MEYCGMDVWRVDDIPFGVRAIQQGVEVDGIWISHPDSGDGSQVASLATLIDDQGGNYPRSKGKTREEALKENSTSESTGSGTMDELAHLASHHISATTTRPRCLARSYFDSSELQETAGTPLPWHLDSYVPSGAPDQLRPERHHRIPATTTEAQTRERGESVVYGAARIRANQDFRRPNGGFEILPAGALGPRQELQDRSDGSEGPGNSQKYETTEQEQPRRLRKKPPVAQLRLGRDDGNITCST